MNNVFARILGPDYGRLPPAVRRFHEVPQATYAGRACVRGASGVLASFIRRVFSFPVPSESVPVRITLERTADLDQWRRNFGGRRFASSFAQHQTGRHLSEGFGPFRFYFSLTATETRLNWHFERWACGPIPLPRALGPRIVSWEGENPDGSYRFFSQAHFPLLGELIYYDGTVTEQRGAHGTD